MQHFFFFIRLRCTSCLQIQRFIAKLWETQITYIRDEDNNFRFCIHDKPNFMLQKKTEEKWFKQQIKTTHVWDKRTVYCNIVKWMNERYRFTTVKYVHLFQWSKKWAKWKKQREKNHRQRLVMERWKKMVNCNMCVIWRFMWRANGEGKRQYTTCICARATEPKCWESEEKDNSLPFNNDTKRKFI